MPLCPFVEQPNKFNALIITGNAGMTKHEISRTILPHYGKKSAVIVRFQHSGDSGKAGWVWVKSR